MGNFWADITHNLSPYDDHRIINFCLLISVTFLLLSRQESFVYELFSYGNSSMTVADFIFIQGKQKFLFC